MNQNLKSIVNEKLDRFLNEIEYQDKEFQKQKTMLEIGKK